MTPDEERQRTWRGAVRAFRLAVAALGNPAPALLADLAAPEDLLELGREPPLVHFSPFDALPNDVAYGRGEPSHRPAGDSGRSTHRVTGRGTPRAGADWSETSRPPGGSTDTSPTAPSFSFRRRGAPDVPTEQPSQRNRDVREHPRGGGASEGRFRAPGSTQGDGQRGGSQTAEARSDRDARPIPPVTLLNDLAEDALKAAEPTVPDVPARPPAGSREPSRKAGHPHGHGDRTPGEPGLEAYDKGGVALIGSLAERLLAPEAPVAGSSPASEVRDGEMERSGASEQPGEAVLDRPPLVYLDDVDEDHAGRPEPDRSRPDPAPSQEAASGRHMDAETFAALVNDVLVRQARRHGVDLS